MSVFSLPDWMPWWAQLLLVITIILLALAFMMMPFSVFGIKPRLDALEARMDEIQGEIRALSLRLPEPGRRPAQGFAEETISTPPQAGPQAARPAAPPQARPPIPPAAWSPDAAPRRPIGAPAPIRAEPDTYRPGGGRVEPRIDRGR